MSEDKLNNVLQTIQNLPEILTSVIAEQKEELANEVIETGQVNKSTVRTIQLLREFQGSFQSGVSQLISKLQKPVFDPNSIVQKRELESAILEVISVEPLAYEKILEGVQVNFFSQYENTPESEDTHLSAFKKALESLKKEDQISNLSQGSRTYQINPSLQKADFSSYLNG
jgi:hypothetical protein